MLDSQCARLARTQCIGPGVQQRVLSERSGCVYTIYSVLLTRSNFVDWSLPLRFGLTYMDKVHTKREGSERILLYSRRHYLSTCPKAPEHMYASF